MNIADELCLGYDSCKECMSGAPYDYCCRQECREHEFCRECSWFFENAKPKIMNGDKNK